MAFSYVSLINKIGITSLSVEDIIELYGTYQNRLMAQFSRNQLIMHLIESGMFGTFIDYDNAECDFNNEKFISLIEFLKSYNNEPQNGRTLSYDDRMSLETQQMVKNDETILFAAVPYGSEMSLAYFEFLYSGTDYSFTGFPSSDSSGIIIKQFAELAVTAACAYPEGAMEFLNFVQSGEPARKYSIPHHFPTDTDILKERLVSYYSDENTAVVYDSSKHIISQMVFENEGPYSREEYLSRDYIELIDVSDEDIDKFVNTILSANGIPSDDTGAIDIIIEEILLYIDGVDTAESAAKRINNRMEIYLSERYG